MDRQGRLRNGRYQLNTLLPAALEAAGKASLMKSLSSSEWTLLGLFLVILVSLVVISKINSSRAADTLGKIKENQAQILVTVEGAVKKSGEYWVPEGTPVEAVLRKAGVKPNAYLKTLPLKKVVDAPLHLQVEELKEIRVSVGGAIAGPLELVLPVGSRICDLKSKVGFTSETDKTFFRRKKLLRNGDKIEVPKKTVEGNSGL